MARSPIATPQGLLCLTITAAAEESNSSTRRRALSRSSRLLNDSGRPWCWRAIESRGGGALVGVLAVGQLEHLVVGTDVQLREVVVGALGEPARDRGVVARGHREGV